MTIKIQVLLKIPVRNVHIIKTTASIITKFCRVIETPKYSLWVVQMCPKQIQDGGRLHLRCCI